MNRLLDTPAYFIVLGLICGFFGSRVGWRSGQRHLFPLVQGLLGFLAFAGAWRATGPGAAALAAGGWVAGVTAFDLYTFGGRQEIVDRVVLHASARREALLARLRGGGLPASQRARAALASVRAVVGFVLTSFLSAGLVAMVVGASRLNTLNAQIVSLSDRAGDRRTIERLRWSMWHLPRVVAYVLLGTAAAEPLAAFLGYSGRTASRTLLMAGLVVLVVDWTLRLFLEQMILRRLAASIKSDPSPTSPAELDSRPSAPVHRGSGGAA